MLRDLFVGAILVVGVASLIRGPLFALLLYLWFAYFRPDQWLWVDWVTPIHLSFLIGVAAVLLTLLFIGQARIRWRLETTLLALFAVLSLLSILAARDQAWAWQSWSDFARVLLIGYLITMHGTDPKRLRLILLVIGLSLSFEAAKQGWVNLIRHPGGADYNPDPVLGDNNGVAMGMFMLVPILFALARTSTSRIEKWGHQFLLGGVVLRGISTYSRGGFLAAGALVLMALATSRRRLRTLIVVLILGAGALSVMPQAFWNRMDTLTSPVSQQDVSARGRLHFWHVAWLMADAHPWTGIGFNSFERAYNQWDDSHGKFGKDRAAHSAWFAVLAEMGWPGLVLLIVILLRALWNCDIAYQLAPPGRDGTLLKEFSRAMAISLVAFAIAATFLSQQYNEMVWHLVCLTMAIAWTAKEMAARRETVAAAHSPRHVSAAPPVAGEAFPVGGPALSWRDVPGFNVES